MKNNIEILAPAGSYEVFKAVINAGADAVYLAGDMFGARAYAENLSKEELISAIEYCKIFNKKLYLTVNTLLKNNEIFKDLYEYIKPLYEAGLDAVIVQDFGVMKLLYDCFPEMEIHASTQMTITDYRYASFLKKYNVSRLVLARELSLAEINKIHAETGLEVETFVHGALCYCYSGLCFMSSFIGGRSGNRGRCAGPCRLDFKIDNKISNLLSLKDLCTLNILPEIIEASVCSLKIEGRMKSAEYAAGVTAIYRKYVDMYLKKGKKEYSVDQNDIDKLLMLFDRGGMTTGYYKIHNDFSMIANENKSDKSQEEKKKYEEYLHKKYVETENKIKVYALVTIIKENPVIMTLSDGENYISVSGDIATKAINKALSQDDVRKQIKKFGATVFELENLDIVMEDDVFVAVKSLNELRRKAIDALLSEKLTPYRRKALPMPEYNFSSNNTFQGISVRVMSKYQLHETLRHRISRIIIECELMTYEEIIDGIEMCHNNNIECYIAFPRVSRYESDYFIEKLDKYVLLSDGFLIRNMAQKEILNQYGFNGKIMADYTCYEFNDIAANCIEDFGIKYHTYPIELNSNELKNLHITNAELLIYGRLPIMISANCVSKSIEKCHKPNSTFVEIKDRKHARMPVLTCCRYCYNIIYNSVPLYLIDKIDSIFSLDANYFGISFTNENIEEVKTIMENTDKLLDNISSQAPDFEFTRGHFARGVE